MVAANTNSAKPGSGKPQVLPSRNGSTHKMAANIRVVVRVRPPNEKELGQNHRLAIDVVDDQTLVFDPKEVDVPFFYQGVQQPTRGFLKRPNKELEFMFDQVCDQTTSNVDVFDVTTKEILVSLMDGYNCSVFVYGATGAGKTFTMIGNEKHPGITYLTMDHLFCMINSFENDREFDIAVSYIEVYNENVFDLLKPSKTPLQLREDAKYGVMVAGLTLHNIKTARELLNMLENGNKNRTQHPTDANAESSRSHAVFQVYVNMRYRTSSEQRVVKLSMIDLAGSERAAATGCVGERFKEGANINRSLLSLGNCINRLADGSSYIPYRDSKLTRLLKDSLGGNCRTVMIANVSPSTLCYEDTYNTLKYAARAKKIQLSIKKNIVEGNTRMSQYVKMNEELTRKIKALEDKLVHASATQVADKERNKGQEQQWRVRISQHARAHGALETRLLTLMSRQHVLALRRRLRAHAFERVSSLAHRSSTEAVEQMCSEDLPRQERAAENHTKQSVELHKKIMALWAKWKQSRDEQDSMLAQALIECPQLEEFVNIVKLTNENRKTKAENIMLGKLQTINSDEIAAFSNYTMNMPPMLKKLYLMLKGYDKVTPSLTEEYLEIMKIAKSGKTISWCDQKSESQFDVHSILKLDFENPSSVSECDLKMDTVEDDLSNTDSMTDSEESTEIENKEPVKSSAKKRKVAAVKLENDTIIIDDSIEEGLNSTKTFSGKKLKRENSIIMNNISTDIENYDHIIDPRNLNSTFVLAGKLENEKKEPIKCEITKKGLTDRTNVVHRTLNFNDKGYRSVFGCDSGADKVACRRPATSATAVVRPRMGAAARAGFGSSLSRDGKPIAAMHSRERMQAHPYSRPAPARTQRWL